MSIMAKAFALAKADVGTWEWADGHNPKIVQYFAEVGHAWVKDDETAWCAAFVGAMLKRAGLPHTGQLTARSYLQWGLPVDLNDLQEGDVCIWRRGSVAWQGHVAFAVRQQDNRILALGGNQRNQVNETWYNIKGENGLLGIRRAESRAIGTEPVEEELDSLLSRALALTDDDERMFHTGTKIQEALFWWQLEVKEEKE